MNRRRLPFAVLLACALSLFFATSAFGAVTITVPDPSAAYLAETTKIAIPDVPPGSAVTSATDGDIKVTFDGDMRATTTGVEDWGNVGQVEEVKPAVLVSPLGVTSRSMQLDHPVYEFGFEAAGWDLGTTTLDVTFAVISDGETLGTITKAISSPFGNFNARLFAIKSDVPFDSIVVTIDTAQGLGFTQLRYSKAAPSAASGTVKSAASGVPIPYAHIAVEYAGSVVAEVPANAQGKYSVVLPSGDYTFHVTGPGWGGISETVTMPDAPLTRDFQLTEHVYQPIYRFFNMRAGVHFYTSNDAEFLNTLNNLAHTFSYDGIAYSVPVSATKGLVPLYRFYNPGRGVHFYTASEAEKNDVITNHSDIYVFEGPAYMVNLSGIGSPVHRYYVPSRNTHFYTADTSEISLSSKLSDIYHYEGIAYWVGAPKPD